MDYVLVGLNHKIAPLALREKLAFDQKQCGDFWRRLLGSTNGLEESAILSTCNRVEIYGVTPSVERAMQTIYDYFSHELGANFPRASSYSMSHDAVVAHLFSVVSSLDSMVIGENQITGQVKEAFRLAQDLQAAGPHLHRLFHRAFSVAKRVKTETQIGRGQVSIGSVVAMLTKKIFGENEDCAITIFGAGEIGKTVLSSLKSDYAKAKVTFINRGEERAKKLEQLGYGQSRPLDELWPVLAESEILISSIAGAFLDFTPENFADLMQKRKNAPLFLIDLGVPRNIDPKVGELENIYLYNIDDLQKIAMENKKVRESEMIQAKNIIDEETKAFYESFADELTKPTIAELNQKIEWIRKTELAKTLARLGHLSESDQQAVDLLTQSLMRKILHDPILHLKNDLEVKQPTTLKLIRRIFRLQDEEENS